jgi:hypothetical protein
METFGPLMSHRPPEKRHPKKQRSRSVDRVWLSFPHVHSCTHATACALRERKSSNGIQEVDEVLSEAMMRG